MRKFMITVNGATYEVDVEEVNGAVQAAAPAPVAAPAAAPAAPVPVPQAAPAVKAAPVAPVSGDTLKAPMPGAILDVKVKAGDTVKKGAVLLILEAMKMENEIVAPRDATIAQVIVSKGSSVNSGDPMLVLN